MTYQLLFVLLLQDCYSHCQEKVVALAARQLTRLFSLCMTEEEGEEQLEDHSNLHNLSIAYGLLVREAVNSQKLCDELSQEVRAGCIYRERDIERERERYREREREILEDLPM